jgi:hypothetical protein
MSATLFGVSGGVVSRTVCFLLTEDVLSHLTSTSSLSQARTRDPIKNDFLFQLITFVHFLISKSLNLTSIIDSFPEN